jgi:hypothetical protein
MIAAQLEVPRRETSFATMHAGAPHFKRPRRNRPNHDDILKAYDTFGNAAKHCALKVVLKAR